MGAIRDPNEREDVSTDRDVTPPWESDQRDVLRATFDQDAEAYDRSRPVAPGDVFDEVMQRASLRAGSTVVEIGPARAKRHDTLQRADWMLWRWSWVRTSRNERGRTWPRSRRSAS